MVIHFKRASVDIKDDSNSSSFSPRRGEKPGIMTLGISKRSNQMMQITDEEDEESDDSKPSSVTSKDEVELLMQDLIIPGRKKLAN
jgi:hypothetical protein